jgi:hypothetical protein
MTPQSQQDRSDWPIVLYHFRYFSRMSAFDLLSDITPRKARKADAQPRRSSGPSVTRFNGSAPPRRSENDNPAGLQRDSDEVEYRCESPGVDAGTAEWIAYYGANCHADTCRQSDERHAIVT